MGKNEDEQKLLDSDNDHEFVSKFLCLLICLICSITCIEYSVK